MTTEDYSEAFLNGWLAHANDVGVDENPYPEKTQSRSNGEWGSGWCARFNTVKHDLDHPLKYVTSYFDLM